MLKEESNWQGNLHHLKYIIYAANPKVKTIVPMPIAQRILRKITMNNKSAQPIVGLSDNL